MTRQGLKSNEDLNADASQMIRIHCNGHVFKSMNSINMCLKQHGPDTRYAKCEMRNAILRLTDPQLDRIGPPPPRAQIQSYSRRERRRKGRLRSFQHLQNGGLKVQSEVSIKGNIRGQY